MGAKHSDICWGSRRHFSDLVGVLGAETEGGSGVCIMSTMMNVTICHCYVLATQI